MLPPDRSHILTEMRNPTSAQIHQESIEGILGLIGAADREVLTAVEAARPAVARFLADAEQTFIAGGRLIYLGAGTSGRLGVLDASEIPPTFQLPPGRIIGIIAGGDGALRVSSEGKEDDPQGAAEELAALGLSRLDTVLGIAAGGTTPYVLGALEIAKAIANPPLTGMLTCAPIARPPACDHLIVAATGPEIVTGSTRMKAGTATKLILNQISTTLMIRSGRVYENLMVDLRATNVKLRDRAARIVASVTGLDRESALSKVDQAGGSVKLAIVMVRKNVDVQAAQTLLNCAGGHLYKVLES
jgi:N-acetylmuramic acid 6-phosphate etherase